MYKVVLIDDEHFILAGLTKVVPWQELGCEVVGTASDGITGLKLVREQQPDLLFTDIRMPNLDGLAMLAALHSEYPRMQTVVLTAYRDFEYARHAITLGVGRYLLKPSKMDEIKEAVKAMTERLDALPALPPTEPEAEPPADADISEASSFIVQSALDYMQAHCAEHISLTDVAEHVYVSQWHLSKLINRQTGQSFFDLLGRMRVERAKKLLADPLMRVHVIAETVGYSDVGHFSKSFKKLTGKTPGEYREQLAGK